MNEQEVKDRIRRIRAKWSNGVSDFADDVRFLLDVIDAATPPPGHIIDDAGNVRKVLGTPWLTDDGAWIGKDARVWVLCRPLNNDDYGWLACPAKMGHDPEDATSPVPWWQVESPAEWRWCEQYEIKGVYSTREAAEAARKEGKP